MKWLGALVDWAFGTGVWEALTVKKVSKKKKKKIIIKLVKGKRPDGK